MRWPLDSSGRLDARLNCNEKIGIANQMMVVVRGSSHRKRSGNVFSHCHGKYSDDGISRGRYFIKTEIVKRVSQKIVWFDVFFWKPFSECWGWVDCIKPAPETTVKFPWLEELFLRGRIWDNAAINGSSYFRFSQTSSCHSARISLSLCRRRSHTSLQIDCI